MPLGNLPRPPTVNPSLGGHFTNANFLGRSKTANIGAANPKLKRYEEVIIRLKKLLAQEKRTLRRVRNAGAREIEIKTALEKILRACLEDVKAEIGRKKQMGNQPRGNVYHNGKSKRDLQTDDGSDKNLSHLERDKIIEVLMSQDRVLNLLFDKTFPSRPAASATQNPLGINSSSMGKLNENANEFNYYGHINQGAPNIEDFTEADILKLEREVEDLLRNRGVAGGTLSDANLVNIQSKQPAFRVTKSAQVGKRVQKSNLMMNAAYGDARRMRQTTAH